jgi:DNA-directed RNA polymerase subunit RPC12/RpoP
MPTEPNLTDTCAKCGTLTEEPLTTEHPDQDSIYCTYRCAHCGSEWAVAHWAPTNDYGNPE